MQVLDELICGLCDDVLIIGVCFLFNFVDESIILVDCMDVDVINSIYFDYVFVVEIVCNYLIKQGRRKIVLINLDSSGYVDEVLLGYK